MMPHREPAGRLVRCTSDLHAFWFTKACHNVPAPLNEVGGAKEFQQLLACRISK